MTSEKLDSRQLNQYGGRGGSLPQTLVMDHVSPATRLLEKRRQMFEVQEALNSQNEEFSRREDAFRRREEGLRRKDLELQESLIKFNKFLQENESKKNRALKRAGDERKQRDLKETEIKRLEAQLKEKMAEEQSLKAEVLKNAKYQEFLESVVIQMTKDFPEVSDVLNRFKTLKGVNKDLQAKKEVEDAAVESLQREYQLYRKEMENKILNGANEIADKQILLEQTLMKKTKLQGDIDTSNLEASDKTTQLGQILSAVSNVLERCEESFRRRHNKPTMRRTGELTDGSSLVEQVMRAVPKLEEVAMFMIDYRDICKEYQDELAQGKDLGSMKMKTGQSVATSLDSKS